MPKLITRVRHGSEPSKPDIVVEFDQNLADADNRKMWEQMLDRRDASNKIKLAVSVGDGLPVALAEDQTIEFALTSTSNALAGIAVAILTFICLWYFMIKRDVLRDDNENSYSLARVQMAFWFSLMFCAFLGILIATHELDIISSQALILMGISAATAMGSMVSGDNKQAAVASRDSSPVEGVGNFFKDLLMVPNGSDGLHRLQIVGWTLVLGGYFAYEAWTKLSMPEIPQSLLVLLGISGSTYVGLKSQEKKS
jgi:hypothetical protein